ncbi:hypothetical protein [Burkholderia anthina]|uniref:hypothetical protein n=1 Tax=Burkholderia anthina TaxID=179879 RepID=UPI001589BDBE|nr:hypothetical protein [Burkholderia anthina]
MTDSLDKLRASIECALDEEPTAAVLAVLIGAFVALSVELVRRSGGDVTKEI